MTSKAMADLIVKETQTTDGKRNLLIEGVAFRHPYLFKQLIPYFKDDQNVITEDAIKASCAGAVGILEDVRAIWLTKDYNKIFQEAAECGRSKVLKYLIQLKEKHGYTSIDPAAQNNSAFRLAAVNGHSNVLGYLRELKNHGYDNIQVE
ncbi:unnamed protein product [Rotaria socialis]|uniref:Ankyrin repeat protein n=1 Tax=Rotaria socialis TaxID=392032 RepID=A0A821RZB2_9BILA|nr:unnamed protein product [Rotaria socialis]CAF4851467.1 unnamed protein product [Rotaria socialis]